MKRGFTLIELLAVIVILAIIALIATPIVLDIIEDSKESANIQSINSLVDMAEMYATTNETTGNLYDKVIDKIEGSKPDNGVVYVNKKGEVALALKYNNKCYVKAYDSNKITQSKDENCIVPVDYLMVVDTTNGETQKVFNSEITKSQVEKIITVSTNEVPVDVIESFDVTENQNGSIMAWYKDEDNNGLYELYIGQDGGVKANPDSTKLFNFYINVTIMDLSNLDTSNVTNMFVMFQRCEKLQNLDLSSFDTSNVTNMNAMFNNCYDLQILNLKGFDTKNVIEMQKTFQGLKSLENLDLSSFNTSNVTNMKGMFANCEKLSDIKMSNFDVSNVTNMMAIFQNCKSLQTLDLSNFNIETIEDVSYMFQNTINLKTINMNKADFTKATIYDGMFQGSGVTNITVKDEITKTFIEARLTDESITGATITIG